MATIDEIKVLLDAVHADDVAEDAAFQAKINELSTTNSTLVTENTALKSEKETTVIELRTILNALTARVVALET